MTTASDPARTPARYTTEQFHTAVLALNPRVAVFDCDGTLWDGDAGYGFMLWSIETGLVSRNASDWIDSRYRLYRTGEVSEVGICGEMTQMYAGLDEAELRRAAAEFFRTQVKETIFLPSGAWLPPSASRVRNSGPSARQTIGSLMKVFATSAFHRNVSFVPGGGSEWSHHQQPDRCFRRTRAKPHLLNRPAFLHRMLFSVIRFTTRPCLKLRAKHSR